MTKSPISATARPHRAGSRAVNQGSALLFRKRGQTAASFGFCPFYQVTEIAAVPVAENRKAALLDFKSSFSNFDAQATRASWQGWNASSPVLACSWTGVNCTGDYLDTIAIADFGLQGADCRAGAVHCGCIACHLSDT